MQKKHDQDGALVALPWVDLAKIVTGAKAKDEAPAAPAAEAASYDDAFRRVSEQLQESDRILTEERLSAPSLYAELLGYPVEERPEVVENDPRFHSYLLAEMLLERGRECWFDHPLKAADWARLALSVIDRLDPADYGSALPARLRVKGYAYLGNAQRIRSDVLAAQETFRRVDELLEDGVFHPSERAEIISLKLSFCKDTRRFDEAEVLLEELTETYELSGDLHQQGRTRLQKATLLLMQGDYETAVDIMRDALDLLDPRREPRAVVSTWITLGIYYNLCGRNAEAQDALDRAREPVERLGDRLSLARIRFAEGRIAVSGGELAEGEQAFIEARDIFIERGISFDAGLASLDLALIYVAQGKTDRVRKMAEEILLIFRSRNMAPEIMAAIILFQHAAEREIATASLIQEISKYLECSREFGVAHGER